MNDINDQAEADARHAAQVDAIAKSVYELLPTFAPKGFTPETVCEGAIKGAVVAIMAGRGLNKFEAADLLDNFAAGLRAAVEPKRGKLHAIDE